MLVDEETVENQEELLDNIPPKYRVDPRLFYHMGSMFLVGAPRKTFRTQDQLGPIGSILRYNFASHSMTKSPHIMNGATPNYVQSDSFDANFEDMMARVAVAQMTVSDDVAKRILGVSSGSIMGYEEFRRFRLASGFTEEQIHKDYERYQERVEEGKEAEQDPGVQALVTKAVSDALAAKGRAQKKKK